MRSGTSAAAPNKRYSGASRLTGRADRTSWKRLPGGEGPTERNAEGCVGADQPIAGAERRKHRTPFADHFVDCLSIRSAHVGDARGDLHLALRIDEHRF